VNVGVNLANCVYVNSLNVFFNCSDRKKDLVKLQAGEYVSLAKVETALKLCPLVDNVCVYADSSKMNTVCLVVPNQKQVEALARRLGVEHAEWPLVCENEALQAAVLKGLQEYGDKGIV